MATGSPSESISAPSVELHCHILPDVDDGAANMDESLEMCRRYARQGTETITATPHSGGPWKILEAGEVREKTARLQERCEKEGIGVEIHPGAEVKLTPELVQMLDSTQVPHLGNAARHLLLELPFTAIPPLDKMVFEMRLRGVTPVLAHVERYQSLASDTGRIDKLRDKGCLMQVSAGAFTGDFGPGAAKNARDLLRGGLVDVVAGDAHGGSNGYWPDFEGSLRVMRNISDEQTVERCCRSNPLRILGI